LWFSAPRTTFDIPELHFRDKLTRAIKQQADLLSDPEQTGSQSSSPDELVRLQDERVGAHAYVTRELSSFKINEHVDW
jgi:hypothetical protein